MEELTRAQFEQMIDEPNLNFIYLYTPMCGTCQLAKKMLNIVEEAIPALKIYMINLNYIGDYAERWKVESVPCLVSYDEKAVIDKVYAFQSVDYLFRYFKQYEKI